MKIQLIVGLLLFSHSALALPVEAHHEKYVFLSTDNPENVVKAMNDLWKAKTEHTEFNKCSFRSDPNQRATTDGNKWVVGWAFKYQSGIVQEECRQFFINLVKEKYQLNVYEDLEKVPGVRLPNTLKEKWDIYTGTSPLIKPLDFGAVK